jgi:hypothetical protein
MTTRAKGTSSKSKASSTKGVTKSTSGKRVPKRGHDTDSDAEDSEPQRQKRSRRDGHVTDVIDCDGDQQVLDLTDDGDEVSNDGTE